MQSSEKSRSSAEVFGRNERDLASLLSLEPLGDDRFRVPYNEANSGGEIFGGQYLGVALSAALMTGSGRAPQAMHAFFLRAARADRTLEAAVERIRDGRSFSHRRVLLFQEDTPVFSADISLHDIEPGQPTHQATMPTVPAPETLRNLHELLETYGDEAVGPLARRRICRKTFSEVRLVNQELLVQRAEQPRLSIWLRAQLDSNDPMLHYAALAYLSDCWVNMASRITHTRAPMGSDGAYMSLGHSLWFHRPADVSDWVLYGLDSPSTHGGVGFNRGALYDRSGRLMASSAQDALVRGS